MWTRSEIKETGKAAFKANYWRCVLVGFILMLLIGGTARGASGASSSEAGIETETHVLSVEINGTTYDSIEDLQQIPPEIVAAMVIGVIVVVAIGLLLRAFIFNPIEVGCFAFFKDNVRQPGASLDAIMTGFRNYGHTFVTLFLRDLYCFLWTLLFLIPGIIKSYSYRMVPYILVDEPDLPANEVIARSREMMDGHKWNSFVLDLSFIGWYLLGIITMNVVTIFWTEPYKRNADAALYEKLRNADHHF